MTVVIFAAINVDSFEAYYSVFIIEFIITTELFVHYNSRARKRLAPVSFLLIGGFLAVVINYLVNLIS